MPEKTIKTKTTNIINLPIKEKTKCVKISRNGERFWLKNPMLKMGNTYTGFVDNHLIEDHPYKFGDVIEFNADEVLEES